MPRSGDLFGEEPLALKEGPQLLPFSLLEGGSE